MFEREKYGFGSILDDYLKYNKISQSDFAERLGVTQKHINSVINGKSEISADLMIGISLITNIDINLIVFAEEEKKIYNYLKSKFNSEKEINDYLKKFQIKELKEKKWIAFKDITSPIQNTMDLLDYLNIRNFDILNNYNERKILFKKSNDSSLIKISLWIARCDKLIKKQKVNKYDKINLKKLLEKLKILRLETYEENKLIKTFNEHGIYLVIEDALKGTKIRGCTSVKINNPAIYLTRLYKDKASLYFTLYHELGHVKSDYNMAKSKIIIDLNEDLEKRADKFALNNMIDEKTWIKIKENKENIKNICREKNIPVCFATSRLAKENIISYQSKIYNDNREKI